MDTVIERTLALLEIKRTGAWSYAIHYELRADLNLPLPLVYTLQRSKDGLTTWSTVTTLVAASGTISDTAHQTDLANETWYRVKCVDGDAHAWYSATYMAGSTLQGSDRIAADNILDTFLLRCQLGEGFFAKLYRGRAGGRCATCYDTVTGLATDENCPECHGTGFTDAYTVSTEFPVKLDTKLRYSGPGAMGNTFTSRTLCQSPAIPWVLLDDLIVCENGDVWKVTATPNQYKYIAAIRDIPLVIAYEVAAVSANGDEYSTLSEAGALCQ